MKISEISIKRPVSTLMVVFIIIILGSISLYRLNVDLLPDISMPIAIISTDYRGAGPNEVEGIVTKNIERVMATVSNIKSVSSISSEGSSMVILEFNQGTDMDFAALDIREKLDMVKNFLPDGVGNPAVLKFDPTMLPIMSLAVYQEGKDMSELGAWINDVLKPRLERIDGVASVTISGGAEEEVKIIVDNEKLAANGLSMNQVANALRMENINAPGGIISEGKYDLLVRTTGEFKSIDDIRKVPIITQSGASFKIEDIAQVEESVKDNSNYSRINGVDSFTLSLQKESTSNTVKVAARVNKELENIRKTNRDVSLVSIIDQSKYINKAISTVKNNGIIGGVLAVLILMMFLKDIRPTLVIGLSIPVSIIATFILVYFAGITLNMISLGGLALGVGMLVDNSIVVLENISRMRQEGMGRIEAAKKGSAQVSMAIIASTLTTICVFLPIVFVEGITAEIFKQLAFTVTFSLISSLVVALTLVPMMSSQILGSDKLIKKNKTMDGLRDRYKTVLAWSLNHRKTVVFITIITFAASALSILIVGTEFFPTSDQGTISISVDMPRGTNHEETVKAMQRVEKIVLGIPEVEVVSSSVGSSPTGMGIMGGNSDKGNINLTLKPLSKRGRKSSDIGDEIRDKTKDIAGSKVTVNSDGNIMMGSGAGAFGAPISIEIRGDDLDKLYDIAEDIVDRIKNLDNIKQVSSGMEKGAPELRVVLDRAKAEQYGLNVAVVSSAVQSSIQGMIATRYKVDGKELDIRILNPNHGQIDTKYIEDLLIQTPLGTSVPLKTIAKLERDEGFIKIDRKDQVRTVTVSCSPKGRNIGKVVKDIQSNLKDYELPEGYSLFYTGENEQMVNAFKDLTLALILGIILVYMVMASQFESLLYPLIIMFTVPLAFTGAFIALFIGGIPLSVPAFLGMIILAGIVVNNGIVLVDFINTLRREGMDVREAIIKAGPTRLQPILMTTLTTVLALVPLSLGIGEGAELELPLAVSVMGGLTFSTILTLIVVPVVYTLFYDLGKKLKKKPRTAAE